MSKARASAMRPLIIPVLFTTCVAMLAGNAAVLIFNLEPLRAGDSNVDHVRRGSHIELLKSSPVEAATAESEYSPAGMPTGTISTLVRESRYGDISAAPILLISRDGIPAYDGLLLRARDQASLTQLQRSILAYDRERPYSIMPAARAYRSSDRNFGDAAVTAQLRESDKPAPYSRVRSTALAEMVVSVAAIAVLVLFYLVIRRSFARQLSVHETLKSHNRDLARVVAQRTRELSELSGHLIRVAEEEKARLARDLHDELGASLTAMKFDVAFVAAKLKDSAPPLAERLQRAIATLRHTFHLKQRLVQDLWPTMLEHVGLSAAVLAHCNEFAFRTGVPCVTDIAEDLNMDADCSIALYRVVQEALTNIAKHAQALKVVVVLKRERGGVTLRISDDGIGISADATNKAGSYGVVGMRERICLLRGKFAISSRAEAGGTLVEAFIPDRCTTSEPEKKSYRQDHVTTLDPSCDLSARSGKVGCRSHSVTGRPH